jgi:hypothetical protein
MCRRIIKRTNIILIPCLLLALGLLLPMNTGNADSWRGTTTMGRAVHTIQPVQHPDSADASAQALQQRLPAEPLEQALPERYLHTSRRLNILVFGTDSRIGENYTHTDANHVISLHLDSGTVEIISVPRDTYSNLGQPDSLQHLNILSNVRAKRGMAAYLHEMSAITGVGAIPYYVEIGFSQALGIMEFLGYKEPHKTLRVLRSRRAYAGGDVQRAYNQAQFIAHTIKRHFAKFDGMMGDMLIRSGLMIVHTNLRAEHAKGIIHILRERGCMSGSKTAIKIRIAPASHLRFERLDFDNVIALDSLHARIEALAVTMKAPRRTARTQHQTPEYAKDLLWKTLGECRADTMRPREIIRRLQRPFEQRAWMQVQPPSERYEIRRWFGELLSKAYRDIHRPEKAQGIALIVRREKEFFLLQEYFDQQRSLSSAARTLGSASGL